MKHLALLLLLTGLTTGCRTNSARPGDAATAIRAALDAQAREWNAGNLEGFMQTYAKSSRTRFASAGDVHFGWQAVFDRYRARYGDRAAMGTLTFSELDVTELGSDAALAFGHWHLKRAADEPHGLFTLLFRRTPEGWRIVHDHTSAAATTAAAGAAN